MRVDERYDVLVVGGGPAGSTCAVLCARAGLNVALVEKSRFPREKICGDCINPRCWDYFRLLGVAPAVEAAPHTSIEAVRLVGSTGSEVVLSLGNTVTARYVAIRRGMLDTILLEQARREGVTVLEGAQLMGLDPGPPARARTMQDGRLRVLTSACVVGADGRNSIVAAVSASGQGRPSGSHPRVGLQWFAGGAALGSASVHMYLLPDGYAGVVEVEPGIVNVALVTRAKLATGETVARLKHPTRLLAGNAELRRLAKDLAPVSRILTASPVNPRTRASAHAHILLAGDARRTVEPFTGEGILFAMRDGVEAARTVLRRSGRMLDVPPAAHSDLWVNRVVSPLLRNGATRRIVFDAARRMPWLARSGMWTVVPRGA